MQLQDLKSLFTELQELKQKVNEIKNNDDLSKNQMKQKLELILPRIEEIETVLKKYNSAFDVNAKCFVEKFTELYLKENPNATVDASHECVGETIEQEHFYGVNKYYKGFAYLDITLINKNNKATFSLFKREITESLDLDLDSVVEYSTNLDKKVNQIKVKILKQNNILYKFYKINSNKVFSIDDILIEEKEC